MEHWTEILEYGGAALLFSVALLMIIQTKNQVTGAVDGLQKVMEQDQVLREVKNE